MSFDPDAFLAEQGMELPETQASNQMSQLSEPTSLPSQAPSSESMGGFDPDEYLKEVQAEKYGTPGQMLKAGVEGVAKGIAGPIAPYLEKHLGIAKPEDILGRQEENPVTAGAGQALGLTVGALTGTGEAAVMNKAGQIATEAVGLAKPVSYLGRVGSTAVQQAAEMAVLQSGDEVAKQVLNDPGASAETALANIGLATAFGAGGGALFSGAVSPLWKATIGNKAEAALQGLVKKFEGGEKEAVSLAEQSGVNIPNELKAVINNEPGAQAIHSALSQTDTRMAGKAYQETLEKFYNDAGEETVKSLGVDPKALHLQPELDNYATGQKLSGTLHDELKAVIEPIEKRYDIINEEFKGVKLTDIDKKMMADEIAQKSLQEGWHKAESDAQMRLTDRVIKKLSEQETVADLKSFMTNLRDAHPFGSDTYQAGKAIKDILGRNQERIISDNIMAHGVPGMPGQKILENAASDKLAEYTQLRQDYSKLMNTIDGLNEHLHVGKYYGPSSFLQALKETGTTSAENIGKRLSGTNKAEILNLLKSFPQTLEGVKQYHVAKLLDSALAKARPGSPISVSDIVNKINKMSPQVKELIATPEQHARIEAIDKILNGLKDPNHNWSNTARTVDKLTYGMPSAISLVAALAGHAGAGAASFIAHLGLSEGKDALKLGLLRFLGSDAKVSGSGFKAMAQYLNNTIKGETLLIRATGNVFKSGSQVLTDKMMPAKEDRSKLDKIVDKFEREPDSVINKLSQSEVGHYLPTHQAALAQTTVQQLNYLKSLKPHDIQLSPLDKPIKPGPAEEARYHRALDIANNPMVVLQRVKDGSVQVSDLQDLKSLYPALYPKMTKMLTDSMISHKSEDGVIPYKTRIGLSLFMGQPLDSTMTPQSIQATQPKPKQLPPQQPVKNRKGTSSLGKQNNTYMTPSQSSEAENTKR